MRQFTRVEMRFFMLPAAPQPLSEHIISPILGWRALISDFGSGARPLPEANISDELSNKCFFYFEITLAITPNLYDSSFDVSSALIAVKGTLAYNLENDSYVFAHDMLPSVLIYWYTEVIYSLWPATRRNHGVQFKQQRAGVAKSRSVEPDVWFWDEPFSTLDPLVKNKMRDESLSSRGMLNKTIMNVCYSWSWWGSSFNWSHNKNER